MENKIIIFIFYLVFLSGCATKQIQQEQTVLKKYVSALQESNADSSHSLDEIKEEIQRLKGEQEKIVHISDSDINSLQERIKDLELKNDELTNSIEQIKQEFKDSLTKLEKIFESQNKSVTKLKTENNKLSIDEKYKKARELHNAKRYQEAESFYTSLVGTKARWYDERVRYHLGLMYFETGDYKQSVITLQEMIDKYSASKFIPKAILTQAKSFSALNQKKEAEVFYKDLLSRYPKSAEAQEAKKKLGNNR